jgi:glucose/arabinose dehydrogenase
MNICVQLGPDNKLYISFGSPANLDLCGKYNNLSECSIVRMNLNGTDLEDYAVGKFLTGTAPALYQRHPV